MNKKNRIKPKQIEKQTNEAQATPAPVSDHSLMRNPTKLDEKNQEDTPALEETKPPKPEKSIPKGSVNDEKQITITTSEKIAKNICAATGTKAGALGHLFYGQAFVMNAVTSNWLADGYDWEERALEALREMELSNATEAMLAIQIISVHSAAVKFLLDAVDTNQTSEGRNTNVLWATRLMRLFNEQLEAMAKLKGKGSQQKVIVEHVNINAGGQAIVGAVGSGKPGQGGGE